MCRNYCWSMFLRFSRLFHRKAGGHAAGALGFYAESWDSAFSHDRAFRTVFLGCGFPNPFAVDMGQVEGERASAEVGAVIIGGMPFAAEVAAVSVDAPFVPDGGSGGIARNRYFRAEVGIPQGGEVKGNPPVVYPAANASAGVRFRGGGGRNAQLTGDGAVLIFLQGQGSRAGSAACSRDGALVGIFRHNGGAGDGRQRQQSSRESADEGCFHT